MFDIFLQVDSLSLVKAVNATGEVESVWSLLTKGGPLMIPLGILFALAVFFFIERLLVVQKAGKLDANFMSIIRDNIVNGNVTAARSLSKNTDNPVARMIDKGLQRIGKPIDAIERSMEIVGKLEMCNHQQPISKPDCRCDVCKINHFGQWIDYWYAGIFGIQLSGYANQPYCKSYGSRQQ